MRALSSEWASPFVTYFTSIVKHQWHERKITWWKMGILKDSVKMDRCWSEIVWLCLWVHVWWHIKLSNHKPKNATRRVPWLWFAIYFRSCGLNWCKITSILLPTLTEYFSLLVLPEYMRGEKLRSCWPPGRGSLLCSSTFPDKLKGAQPRQAAVSLPNTSPSLFE